MVSNPWNPKCGMNNKFFDQANEKNKLKINRAKHILALEQPIRKVTEDVFLVRSQTGRGWYKLSWNGMEWICNCVDYEEHGDFEPCKHIIALKMLYRNYGRPVNKYDSKEIKKTYPQDWKNYNLAQMHEFELFDQFLYQLVSDIEEPEQNSRGRPRIKLQDQLFCCIMKVYSQLSLRRSQCLFEQALERHQISHSPHFNSISNTLNREDIQPILQELVRLSAKPLARIETSLATSGLM